MSIEFSKAKIINQTMVLNFEHEKLKDPNKPRQGNIGYYISLIKYFGAPSQCNDCACGLVY